MALTVGVGTVMDAREVVVLVSGAHKADALMKCIELGVNHMYTMSAIQVTKESKKSKATQVSGWVTE